MDQTERCGEGGRPLWMATVGACTVSCLATIGSAARGGDATNRPHENAKIDFQTDVAPILREKCVDCHGPEMQLADLRLDQRQFVIVDGEDRDLIKPGHGSESLLIQRLVDKELGLIMPPFFPIFPEDKAGLLSESQIEILTRWIDQGADWPEGVVLSEEPAAEQFPEAKALFAAIRAADTESVAQILLDRFLVNTTDHHGATPLMHAALYADVALVRLLIGRGADVNAADKSGTTALMLAAGDPEKVRVLLKHGAKVDARTTFERTPLLIACTYADNIEVVRLLLDAGAGIEDHDRYGETVVTSASKQGGTELLELLIAAGADIRGGGGLGERAPLVWAAGAGHADTIDCLLRHGAGRDAEALNGSLFVAAVRGHTDVVRLLLEHEADPSTACGFAGYTPLMGAAYSEALKTEIVRMLLQRGANVQLKAANGETALSLARKRGHTEIVDLLEQAGATE